MTRAQRIKAAKAALAEVAPHYEHWKRAFDNASTELQKALDSFDIGEKVQVTKTCRRGCCIEMEFQGIIHQHGKTGRVYKVRRDDGALFDVSTFDMRRVSHELRRIRRTTLCQRPPLD